MQVTGRDGGAIAQCTVRSGLPTKTLDGVLVAIDHRTVGGAMAGLEDREIVVLLLGLLVAGFSLANLDKLRALPRWRIPMCAAALLIVGWTASILETWFAPSWLNLVEHCAYLAHSALMLAWVYLLWQRTVARKGLALR